MRNALALISSPVIIVFMACSTGSGGVDEGSRQLSRYSVAYEGPELHATLRFYQAARDLGGGWLILVAHLRGAHSSGITVVHRHDISVRTPTGAACR